MAEIYRVLKEQFGFDTFRGEQEVVVRAALSGKHSLVLMPTGMGKSLCFQLPAKILQGSLTIVLSPLIALMKDQVDQARKKGIKAAYLNSSQSKDERQRVMSDLKNLEILYVTPERFRKDEFREALKSVSVKLLAVDEAHCVSQWGHDFRPDYSRVHEIRQLLHNPTVMALTATATAEVQKDILQTLGLQEAETQVFQQGIERPNLFLRVEEVYGLEAKVDAFLASAPKDKSVIVYFSLIQTLEKFSQELEKKKFVHSMYHGEQPRKIRSSVQNAFLRDGGVILATPAFGLGIDKPDVRAVYHAEIPGSLEAYYQEVGRAGRDGDSAECVLLYDEDDASIQMDFVKWANPDTAFIQKIHSLIAKNSTRYLQEGADFLRAQMNFYNKRDFRVETALNLLERWGCLDCERGEIVEEIPEEYLHPQHAQERLRRAQMRLLKMVQYASGSWSDERCRKNWIYQYFGITKKAPCGACDLCVSK